MSERVTNRGPILGHRVQLIGDFCKSNNKYPFVFPYDPIINGEKSEFFFSFFKFLSHKMIIELL